VIILGALAASTQFRPKERALAANSSAPLLGYHAR
jgi:hypothetical protein